MRHQHCFSLRTRTQHHTRHSEVLSYQLKWKTIWHVNYKKTSEVQAWRTIRQLKSWEADWPQELPPVPVAKHPPVSLSVGCLLGRNCIGTGLAAWGWVTCSGGFIMDREEAHGADQLQKQCRSEPDFFFFLLNRLKAGCLSSNSGFVTRKLTLAITLSANKWKFKLCTTKHLSTPKVECKTVKSDFGFNHKHKLKAFVRFHVRCHSPLICQKTSAELHCVLYL